jgi:hypothetical protein
MKLLADGKEGGRRCSSESRRPSPRGVCSYSLPFVSRRVTVAAKLPMSSGFLMNTPAGDVLGKVSESSSIVAGRLRGGPPLRDPSLLPTNF